MDLTLPAVLLMGGGEGMGPVKRTAEALEEALFDKEHGRPIGQMVVICGRNEALAASLQELEWNIPIKVCSFCLNSSFHFQNIHSDSPSNYILNWHHLFHSYIGKRF